MQKKIRLLIITAVLGLIALSIIQGYLIYNTFELKKDAFITESRKSISRIDDFSPSLDTINEIWQEKFRKLLIDYQVKRIQKEEVLQQLKFTTDSLNKSYIANYNKELAKKNLDYDLKFQKRVKTIIITDSTKTKVDTIFKATKKLPKFLLMGEVFSEKSAHKISNSMWITNYETSTKINGKEVPIKYDLQFETQDFMNVEDWENIVLYRMKGLLAVSVFIFLIVFALLYYSIKNLITQKKIADIKTDFVNNITHELKTPLATLSLATKMLKKDEIKKQPKIVETTVNTIERQNKRLQKLIDQVLTNSLGYQEIKLNKEKVHATEYLNTVLDDFLLSVSDKNVVITKEIIATKEEINIDKFYMTTAIFNILENAVKYNDADQVNIHFLAKMDKNLLITIKDNGIGISAKNQQQLFEKFFRVGNKNVHNVKGLGLGLYYTHQIIKAHHGVIKLKSVAHKGTSFSIEIPISA